MYAFLWREEAAHPKGGTPPNITRGISKGTWILAKRVKFHFSSVTVKL